MSHIVFPCYHLEDCTWLCGPVLGLSVATPPFYASVAKDAALHPRTIKKITIERERGQPWVIDFEGTDAPDPDVLVFSEAAFDTFVYEGVKQKQGKYLADRIKNKLKEKADLQERRAKGAKKKAAKKRVARKRSGGR